MYRIPLIVTVAVAFAACGGGGSVSAPPTPMSTPTILITPTPPSPQDCTAAGSPQSVAIRNFITTSKQMTEFAALLARRMPIVAKHSVAYVPNELEVVYDRANYVSTANRAMSVVRAVSSAKVARTVDFERAGRRIDILRVSPTQMEFVRDLLSRQPGVLSVARPLYRHRLTTTVLQPNDAYYQGFPPANVPPFYESATSAGQWDMHVLCLANAWGYSQTNSTGKVYPATGSTQVPIAIIDTGADLTHPELSGKVLYSETDQAVASGTATAPPPPPNQTTAPMHDNDGHGTDVAGIAAEDSNNNLGFAAPAYGSPLMIFRVFPDPPLGGCGTGSSSPQCDAQSIDIAAAINSAVSHGAKVINLSLGSGTCTNGADPDPLEGAAIGNALNNGVVVVAASGNDGAGGLDAPACDSGVIAVGATTVNDANSSNIFEAVASYSNYAAGNSRWGVVAPGGDPSGGGDNDLLHWIENIFSSTSNDPSFPASKVCAPDHNAPGGSPLDCRVLIAGTSQATPHVAGVAALILSVNPSLSPASVASLLCDTSVPVSGDIKQGCGRVNAYRALARAVGDASVP